MVKQTDRPAMTIAVDMGRKATKTNKQNHVQNMLNVKIYRLQHQTQLLINDIYMEDL